MSANQAATAATNICRDISSVVIEGLGTIQPESLPISQLIQLFEVGDTWNKDDSKLQALDDRVRKQFSLNVNAADFQPFRVQKHVIDLMSRDTNTSTKRQDYAAAYNANQRSWNISGGFGIGPFSASGGYSSAAQKANSSAQMSDDEFKDMLKTYHGVEYNTEDKLWRGVKIYDLQSISGAASTSIISVTYKPYLSSGVRNLNVRPSTKALLLPKTVEEEGALIPDASGNPAAPVRFYFNYQGNVADRHDMYQVSGQHWVEKGPNNRLIAIFATVQRGTVDGNTGTVVTKQGTNYWIFIPDKKAQGQWNTLMRQSFAGPTGPWGPFQYMLGIQ